MANLAGTTIWSKTMDEDEHYAFEEWREETPINEMLTGDELDMVLFWFKGHKYDRAIKEMDEFILAAWQRHKEDEY